MTTIQRGASLLRFVQGLGQRLHAALLRHERAILYWSMATFVAAVTIIGSWKLWAFGYNALDLAIYNQVAWTSVHGHLFGFTIHPHSYLGDHLELALAALFPIYTLLQHPLTLVIIQAFVIALAVIPIVKIAARFVGKPWHLLFGFAYLANPTIQNMSLYEFHLLPFAIPLVSWALLRYVEGKFLPFLIFCGLALTVREDVSLVVLGFGLLGLVDRRKWHWSVLPLLLGTGWLIAATKISAVLNDYGSYKFLVYYRWLGNSLPEMLRHALQHPGLVLQHLTTWQNAAFLTGLLLPFAFLPVFRLRWLVPAVPTLLQLLLAVSSGELLIEIHYPAVLLPFLTVATAAAFAEIISGRPRIRIFRPLASERAMTATVFVVVILYSMTMIGPFIRSVPAMAATRSIARRVQLERDITKSVQGEPTIAGLETLTELSGQRQLYSLHYVLLGKKQFSSEPYVVPDDAKLIIIDTRDLLLYQLLYKNQDAEHYGGYRRIRTLLEERNFRPILALDRFTVYARGSAKTDPPFTIGQASALLGTPSLHGDLEFLGWTTPSAKLQPSESVINNHYYRTFSLRVTFQKKQANDLIRQIEIRFVEHGKVLYKTLAPLGGGIFPSSDWPLQTGITSNLNLLVPDRLIGKTVDVELRILDLDGDVVLSPARSLVLRYNRYVSLGGPILLGQLSLTR